MPLPTRRSDETHEDFLSRCMGAAVMVREFPDSAQRYAVCKRQADAKSAGVLELLTEPGAVTIEAAAADAGGKPALPRFTMVAYTGGTMRLSGWRYPVVVDLAGLSIPSQSRPIRFGHDVASGVGHTDSIRVMEGKLVATGVVSRDTAAAKEVVTSAKNGFPWQASIGASVEEFEFVKDGQSAAVNGKEFKGPVNVVRKSTLGEISFVDLGADADTSASLAARHKEREHMDEKETQKDERQEVTAGAVETPDPVAEMRVKAAAEARRIATVRRVCAGRHPDIEAKAIEEGWDEAKTELEVLRAERPKAPSPGMPGDRTVGRNTILATAYMAGGVKADALVKSYGEQAVEAAEKLRGIGIQDFFRLSARMDGVELPICTGNGGDFIRAAFSTMSLPGILSNVANKMLLEGYTYIEDAWRKIVKISSVKDFKEHTRYRLTDDLKFEKVGPDGELKHGKLGEQTFTNQAETYGKMFSLTRTLIINDDLGAFLDIPKRLGMEAAHAVAEAVWTLLLSNPGGFFSSGNKNYLSGADTALSVDSLTAAELLFLDQTQPNGRPLGIGPSILLVPNALKVLAEQLMSSLKLNETTTANKPKPTDNPHAGKFTPVSSAYLGNASIAGYSTKAWYLFADPNRLAAFEVVFLNGVEQPTVEQAEADFDTLGVQFRAYIDFGMKEQDFRGAVKVKGEA